MRLSSDLGHHTRLDGCSYAIVYTVVNNPGVSAVAVVLLANETRVSATNESWVLVVIADMEAKASRIDVAVAPEEKSTEHRLGQYVKNTVENSLGVGRDDVSTLGKSPCDGIEKPEEDGPDTTDEVGS